MLKKFWNWYERTYAINISVATVLFLLQIVHLVWLTGFVVWERVFGTPLFSFEGIWSSIIVLVDYTEIPALLSISLVYIHELRQRYSLKNVWYLIFVNTQWLHLFWITDEFVETAFNGAGTVLPFWLALVAIGIDYLELPVMVDTVKRFVSTLRGVSAREAFKELQNS